MNLIISMSIVNSSCAFLFYIEYSLQNYFNKHGFWGFAFCKTHNPFSWPYCWGCERLKVCFVIVGKRLIPKFNLLFLLKFSIFFYNSRDPYI